MIVEKKSNTSVPSGTQETPTKITTLEEAYNANPLIESYKAIRAILQDLHVDGNPDAPLLFRTIKLDNGQLNRIKNNKFNKEYGLAFPAVLIHFIDVYYNVGQSRIGEGKGVMRIHYILNTLNNSDDEVELQGFKVYQQINEAIQKRKSEFPALVTRFQLKYWDQPLTFDDGLQPYWIDYEIWFNDYTAYRYKDYEDHYIVFPPYTNHSDQLPENNENDHEDHRDVEYDDYPSFEGLEIVDSDGNDIYTDDDDQIYIP